MYLYQHYGVAAFDTCCTSIWTNPFDAIQQPNVAAMRIAIRHMHNFADFAANSLSAN